MRVADWPFGLRDLDVARPAVPAGVRAVSCVALDEHDAGGGHAADAHLAARRHEVGAGQVMVVPPVVGPDVGETDVSVGPPTAPCR